MAANSGRHKKGKRTAKPRPDNVIPLKTVKKKQPKRTGAGEALILFISIALFTVSVGGTLWKYVNRKEVATMVVPYGSIDIPRVITGIIIRDEEVYSAEGPGEVTFLVDDQAKVKNGQPVCIVKDPSNTSYLESESVKLSQKILDMQQIRMDVSSFSGDVANINAVIQAEVNKSLFNLAGGDYSYVYKLKNTVVKNVDKRNDLLLNENKGSVESFVNENRQYAGKIAENTSQMQVKSGGIVSYAVDGFENVVTLENMGQINKEQTVMSVPPSSERVYEAFQGTDVFKIIKSNEWYIASYIDNELIPDWALNNTVSIYLEKDDAYEKLSFKVHKLEAGEKETFVILKTNKQMLDYLHLRTVSFKTYDSVFKGVKIPENAICERTFLKIPAGFITSVRGSDAVIKQDTDKTEDVLINIKYLRTGGAAENFVYVLQDYNNIKRGDTIVTPDGGKTYVIDEIVSAKGVFRANNGIASFTSIDVEGMVKGNNGYVILDAKNSTGSTGIKVYDVIVSDAVNNFIKEGDKIN